MNTMAMGAVISLRRACEIVEIAPSQPGAWVLRKVLPPADTEHCSAERLLVLTLTAALVGPIKAREGPKGRQRSDLLRTAIQQLAAIPNLEEVSDCDAVWDIGAREAAWATSSEGLRLLVLHERPFVVIPMAERFRRSLRVFRREAVER